MTYEINVSKNKEHFFATAEQSCNSKSDLIKVWNDLIDAGFNTAPFKMSVTQWSKNGIHIDMNVMLNNIENK